MAVGSRRQRSIFGMAGSLGTRQAASRPAARGMSGWQLVLKRVFDVIIAVVALLVALPLGVMVGIVVRLGSPGPVFFAQTRVGKDGKQFTLYKFRSMRAGSEELRQDMGHLSEAGELVFKMRRDPRVTKLGAFLRRTSLDELPQLINVLKGDMSLVGPRPPLPSEVEKYNDYQRGRLAVKPGITCLWQTQGRSSIPFDKWVELDLEYIRSQSLWLDFKILVKTVPAVLKGTGAW